MIIKGMNETQIRLCASNVGVDVDIKTLNNKGTRHRVKVNLAYGPDRERYRRISHSGRKVNAVCWHGFRDFFRECYAIEPNAEFRTALDHWKESEDFENRYRESGLRNIGSQAVPLDAANACECGEGAE
jgi:hypothetical protein